MEQNVDTSTPTTSGKDGSGQIQNHKIDSDPTTFNGNTKARKMASTLAKTCRVLSIIFAALLIPSIIPSNSNGGAADIFVFFVVAPYLFIFLPIVFIMQIIILDLLIRNHDKDKDARFNILYSFLWAILPIGVFLILFLAKLLIS